MILRLVASFTVAGLGGALVGGAFAGTIAPDVGGIHVDGETLRWVVGLAIAAGGALLTRSHRRIVGDVGTCLDRIRQLEEKATRNQTKIDFVWDILEQRAVQLLHSPHTPELDILLESWAVRTIDDEGVRDLVERLRAIVTGEDPREKTDRLIAGLLLAAIELRLNEAEAAKRAGELPA